MDRNYLVTYPRLWPIKDLLQQTPPLHVAVTRGCFVSLNTLMFNLVKGHANFLGKLAYLPSPPESDKNVHSHFIFVRAKQTAMIYSIFRFYETMIQP